MGEKAKVYPLRCVWLSKKKEELEGIHFSFWRNNLYPLQQILFNLSIRKHIRRNIVPHGGLKSAGSSGRTVKRVIQRMGRECGVKV